MAKRRAAQDIAVTGSSGNVFADLGLPEPEEELTKAQLASHIREILQRRRLTQAAAAALMGIDQPKVSALLNGRLANFSSERLMRLLTALGHDVEIAISAEPRPHARGRIRVSSATTYPEPYPEAGSRNVTSAPGFSETASGLASRGKRRSHRS
jgi:predicted XRE-type DNA-binding protein